MKKLLIIEDDQIVAHIYRSKFVTEGFHVEVAATAEEGLQILQKFTPDAFLLDLMLPTMSGLELIKHVRSQPAFHHLPIVVFSNTYLTNMVQDAWKAGATKCLSKANCSPKQVIEAINAALAKGNAKPDFVNGGGAAAQAGSRAQKDLQQPTRAGAVTGGAGDNTLQQQFIARLPETLSQLRNRLKDLLKATDESSKLEAAQQLYGRVHATTSNAAMAGMSHVAQLCEALEALLKELQERPKNINSSTLRTLANAVDCLGVLFANAGTPQPQAGSEIRVLVVDDEPISRRAISAALDKARLKSTSIEVPSVALEELRLVPYDLVFLDVDMPGMNGYELCSKLREIPSHKTTPVVFVTALTDLEARANSMMSGGNDFIAKPFLFMELAVKALIHVLRRKSALISRA